MPNRDDIVLFAGYTLNTARACLLRDGEPIHLRPQAYRALKFFAEHRGRLVTKEELIGEVWDGRAVTDDSLVQCLRDVRKAIGAETGRHLKTERGLGDIIDIDTKPALEPLVTSVQAAAEGGDAICDEGRVAQGDPATGHVDLRVIGAMLSCVAVAGLVWLVRPVVAKGELDSVA